MLGLEQGSGGVRGEEEMGVAKSTEAYLKGFGNQLGVGWEEFLWFQ